MILLDLLVLLRLAVEAVVCLLQQTSKQSFQLLRPADKRNKRQNGGGGGSGAPQGEVSETSSSHLSRQVLGSESSPRHMAFGAPSPSEWSFSAQSALGQSVLGVGGRLLIHTLLCDITAPGQCRGRSRERTRRLLDTDFPSV